MTTGIPLANFGSYMEVAFGVSLLFSLWSEIERKLKAFWDATFQTFFEAQAVEFTDIAKVANKNGDKDIITRSKVAARVYKQTFKRWESRLQKTNQWIITVGRIACFIVAAGILCMLHNDATSPNISITEFDAYLLVAIVLPIPLIIFLLVLSTILFWVPAKISLHVKADFNKELEQERTATLSDLNTAEKEDNM